MNRAILFFIVLAILLTPIISAQTIDSTRLEFFPLHLGDEWQYYFGYYDGAPGYTRNYRVVNVDTLMPNGKLYFQLNDTRLNSLHILYRVDSLYRIWESYGSPNPDTCLGFISEQNFYRLNEPDSAVWQVCYNKGPLSGPPYLFRYDGISFISDFGATRQLMFFEAGGNIVQGDSTFQFFGASCSLMQNFGIYYEGNGERSFMQLIGAIIKGVKYGSLDKVEPQTQAIPIGFQLFQNYPNPFNSSTEIRFLIPLSLGTKKISLRVFNVLGQEIKSLFNGILTPGVNTVSWDGKNEEAIEANSGVYFISLEAPNYRNTIKALMIK